MRVNKEYLSFELGESCYAVPITLVKEIVGLGIITPLPMTPASVRGVVNLRGSMLPVVDLRILLGMSMRPYHKYTVVVIVEIAKLAIGLIVDAVMDVLTLTDEQTEPPPINHQTPGQAAALLGLAEVNGRVLLLLDAVRILTDPVYGVIREGTTG